MFSIVLLGGLGVTGPRSIVQPDYGWDPTNGAETRTYSEAGALVLWDGTGIGAGDGNGTRSVTGVSTGKVYCEFELVSQSDNNNYHGFGIVKSTHTGYYVYDSDRYSIGSRAPNASNGCGLPLNFRNSDGTYTSDDAYAFAVGDRIGIALDATNGKLWYRINGSWVSGDPGAGTGETHNPTTSTTYYFASLNYSCNASNCASSARIYPAAAVQTGSMPTGFSAYQPG